MESFYRTHKYLVNKVCSPVPRLLMHEIDWSHRLIGIKGSRGVGKTTFLLQYAKDKFGDDASCLYINFNSFYFTEHTLVEFAGDFYKRGGKTLLIDQTFKYENWSKELRECYELYPHLKIVFSGSSVMRLIEDNDDLADIVTVYNLRGFSFREYLNLKCKTELQSLKLSDIIEGNYTEFLAELPGFELVEKHFLDYLHHGYYPFFLENRNYSENLLKTMNMMLEVDILLIKQIELKYLSKIRKLLYMLLKEAPFSMNVSNLSSEIETSRATVMNYIKYLKDARLLNLLYEINDENSKKPKQVFAQNTNIMHAVYPDRVDQQSEYKTFAYNALHARHKINSGIKNTDFIVDQKWNLKIHFSAKSKQQKMATVSIYNTASTKSKSTITPIPIWLLGFLY